jgi:2'-5' RNA ligase
VEPTHSALIVAVPEAEPAVARHRERLDTAASWGVSAHITVLYPFLPPAEIDQQVLDALADLAAAVPAFDLTLNGLGWFRDDVLWLSPHPAEPFRRLTAAVAARFPAAQPYGGEFEEVVPHLTLGHNHPVATLTAAGEETLAHLPIHARVDRLTLITGRPEPGGSWPARAVFPLG